MNGSPKDTSPKHGGGGGEQITAFTYRLSCGLCKGECRDHFDGHTEEELNAALVGHYNDLWEIVQAKEDKEWDEDLPLDLVITTGSDHTEFGYSSLGRHLTKHLRHATSRKEVKEWCIKNVSVKVKVHKYEKRPENATFGYKETKKKAQFVVNKERQEEAWEEKKRAEEAAHLEKLKQANALSKDGGCFDMIWMQRYEELEKYAAENDGSTNVPLEYGPSPLLGKWVHNQRQQYRRKHNVRPKLDEGSKVVFGDEKEMMLRAIGFRWFDAPKQRWSERGIAVMYGIEDKEDC